MSSNSRPDVRLMAEIFEMEGVDFRVIVLVRNSRDTLLSMLSQRAFIRDFERAANMSESILRRDMVRSAFALVLHLFQYF